MDRVVRGMDKVDSGNLFSIVSDPKTRKYRVKMRVEKLKGDPRDSFFTEVAYTYTIGIKGA